MRFIKRNWLYLSLMAIWLVLGIVLQIVFSQEDIFLFANQKCNATFYDFLFYYWSGFGRGETALVLFIFFIFLLNYKSKQFLFAVIATAILASTATRTLKYYFSCPRPLVELAGKVRIPPHADYLYQLSFPSGHTLGAFALSSFIAFILPQKYRYWSILAFIMAIGVGFSRMYLGAHFFKDIYIGSIIGFCIAILGYYFGYNVIKFKNYRNAKREGK